MKLEYRSNLGERCVFQQLAHRVSMVRPALNSLSPKCMLSGTIPGIHGHRQPRGGNQRVRSLQWVPNQLTDQRADAEMEPPICAKRTRATKKHCLCLVAGDGVYERCHFWRTMVMVMVDDLGHRSCG